VAVELVAGLVCGLGIVDNNPLKYIDPTGHVKVIPADINLENYEIDVLSPIEGTYQNNNLFLCPYSDSIFAGLGFCLCQR
jgi:hypothetical protein